MGACWKLTKLSSLKTVRLKHWGIVTICKTQIANCYSVMTIRPTSPICQVFRITNTCAMLSLLQASLICWMSCKKQKEIAELKWCVGWMERNETQQKLTPIFRMLGFATRHSSYATETYFAGVSSSMYWVGLSLRRSVEIAMKFVTNASITGFLFFSLPPT